MILSSSDLQIEDMAKSIWSRPAIIEDDVVAETLAKGAKVIKSGDHEAEPSTTRGLNMALLDV